MKRRKGIRIHIPDAFLVKFLFGFARSVLYGIVHTGSTCRLYAVHPDRGTDLPDGICNAGNQTAASDRNHNGVDSVQIIQNFQRNCALTGDNVLIVKGMYRGTNFLHTDSHQLSALCKC